MKKIVTFLLIVNTLSSFSQTINLNLSTTLQTALEKDKNIKNSEITLENAKLDKKQAIKGGLPSISYSGNILESDGDESSKYNLTLSQTLFNGFKTTTNIKNASEYIDYYNYSLNSTRNEISLEILNKYITILKLTKKLEIYNSSKEEIESNQKRVKRLYELDLISKTDVLDLNYSLIEIDTNIIETSNSLEIEKMSLKNSLNLDNNDNIILADIEDLSVDINLININSDVKLAKLNNVSIKQAKSKTKLVKALETVEKSEFLPVVNLDISYGNIQYIDGIISDSLKSKNMDLYATISITGTLFDWGKNMDAYKTSINNSQITKNTETTTIENVELNIKKSYLELIRLDKLKEAKIKALESSTENFKYQKQKYENQLINTSDFLNAENKLRESEISVSNAKLDLYYEYQNYLSLLK